MRKQTDYQRGYQKGYNTGYYKRLGWPEHTPPNPPQKQVAALFQAAKELRDAALGVVQVIIPDTEPFIDLEKKALAVDTAFEEITAWLKTTRP